MLESKKLLTVLAIIVILHLLVGSIQVIMPVIATKLDGNGASNLGYIGSFLGIGTVLTALLLSVISIKNREGLYAFSGELVNAAFISCIWSFIE